MTRVEYIMSGLWLAMVVLAARPAAADQLEDIEQAIDAWRLEDARRMFDDAKVGEDESPRARYIMGKLLFYEGECGKALKALRKAIEGARHEVSWKALRDRVEATEAIFAKLEVRKGEGDTFLYRYASGADAILLPYADEALKRQRKALKKILGDAPERPVEIVFLPDVESLSLASGLPPEQIERTGTVGVTKFGRVMMVTPRRLVTGYPWLDTLAHELTHFSINRVSNNRTPIWLHEAVAKLLERRWRSKDVQVLTPEEAYLLDRAVKEGRLIPLRRFHPSVAYLSDQEEAALAYAQALSFARYLQEKIGAGWLRTLLADLGVGMSLDEGLMAISQADLKRLYLWWRQMASGKRHTPVPAVALMKRRFKRGEVGGGSDLDSVLAKEVKRHLRIGDLLRLRGHLKAAVAEYEQAKALSNSPSPEITDRLAACFLNLGQNKETIALLEPMVQLYPSHATTLVQLGRALANEKRAFEAIRAFEKANAINPFHPDVHCRLAELHELTGHTKDAARETEHCRMATLFAGTSTLKK